MWISLGLTALLAISSLEDKTAPAGAQGAGRCLTDKGSILRRAAGATDWQLAAKGDPLPAGDLLVGLPGAMLESPDGAVHLRFLAELQGQSPLPVKEAAVILRDPAGADLDFVLDRGRVDLFNRKTAGAATVRLHVRQEVWDLSLEEPGTRLAIELYGRWPRGTHFRHDAPERSAPTAEMVFLAVQGRIMLKHAGEDHVLQAPPGPALLEWDSVHGQDEAAHHLDRLPAWAKSVGPDRARLEASRAIVVRLRAALAEQPIERVMQQWLHSDKPEERRVAVNVMAVLDRLDLLAKAMRESKDPDVFDNGVLAMRHWIGRGPGQDQRLYEALVQSRGFKPVQAETVVQLLHSFGDEDLARPETYQTLIDYLSHHALAIRALAYWHLERLVPAGRSLGYHPTGPEAEREAAVARWRKLVPPGTVPPRPTAGEGRR